MVMERRKKMQGRERERDGTGGCDWEKKRGQRPFTKLPLPSLSLSLSLSFVLACSN